MAVDYGFGDLGNKLLDLFRAGAPDFEAAEELIRQGADLNAAGKYDDENILSEILSGYWCVSNECTDGEKPYISSMMAVC